MIGKNIGKMFLGNLTKGRNYNDQFLFLLAIFVISIVGYYVFGGVEGMKNCCGRCGGGGCGADMHWGWPGKMPPAHQLYGGNGSDSLGSDSLGSDSLGSILKKAKHLFF